MRKTTTSPQAKTRENIIGEYQEKFSKLIVSVKNKQIYPSDLIMELSDLIREYDAATKGIGSYDDLFIYLVSEYFTIIQAEIDKEVNVGIRAGNESSLKKVLAVLGKSRLQILQSRNETFASLAEQNYAGLLSQAKESTQLAPSEPLISVEEQIFEALKREARQDVKESRFHDFTNCVIYKLLPNDIKEGLAFEKPIFWTKYLPSIEENAFLKGLQVVMEKIFIDQSLAEQYLIVESERLLFKWLMLPKDYRNYWYHLAGFQPLSSSERPDGFETINDSFDDEEINALDQIIMQEVKKGTDELPDTKVFESLVIGSILSYGAEPDAEELSVDKQGIPSRSPRYPRSPMMERLSGGSSRASDDNTAVVDVSHQYDTQNSPAVKFLAEARSGKLNQSSKAKTATVPKTPQIGDVTPLRSTNSQNKGRGSRGKIKGKQRSSTRKKLSVVKVEVLDSKEKDSPVLPRPEVNLFVSEGSADNGPLKSSGANKGGEQNSFLLEDKVLSEKKTDTGFTDEATKGRKNKSAYVLPKKFMPKRDLKFSEREAKVVTGISSMPIAGLLYELDKIASKQSDLGVISKFFASLTSKSRALSFDNDVFNDFYCAMSIYHYLFYKTERLKKVKEVFELDFSGIVDHFKSSPETVPQPKDRSMVLKFFKAIYLLNKPRPIETSCRQIEWGKIPSINLYEIIELLKNGSNDILQLFSDSLLEAINNFLQGKCSFNQEGQLVFLRINYDIDKPSNKDGMAIDVLINAVLQYTYEEYYESFIEKLQLVIDHREEQALSAGNDFGWILIQRSNRGNQKLRYSSYVENLAAWYEAKKSNHLVLSTEEERSQIEVSKEVKFDDLAPLTEEERSPIEVKEEAKQENLVPPTEKKYSLVELKVEEEIKEVVDNFYRCTQPT